MLAVAGAALLKAFCAALHALTECVHLFSLQARINQFKESQEQPMD